MNKIANKFLLAGDKFMPEMQLKQLVLLDKSGFIHRVCGPFTKKKKEFKNLKKQEIQDIYTEMSKINFAFNVICLIKILMKHLILLKIQNMMDIKEVLLLWLIIFFVKSLLHLQINLLRVVVSILLLNKMNN